MKGVTPYQTELLMKLRDIEATSGKLVDFDQLLTQLSWAPSKESAQFTIRAVIQKGFMEKRPIETRRGRNRVCYQITHSGMLILDPRHPIPGVSEFIIPSP